MIASCSFPLACLQEVTSSPAPEAVSLRLKEFALLLLAKGITSRSYLLAVRVRCGTTFNLVLGGFLLWEGRGGGARKGGDGRRKRMGEKDRRRKGLGWEEDGARIEEEGGYDGNRRGD